MSKKLLNIALIFLVVSLLLGNSPQSSKIAIDNDNPILIKTNKTEFRQGKALGLEIINQTNKQLNFNFKCPNLIFKVYEIKNGKEIAKNSNSNLDCQDSKSQKYFNFSIEPLSKLNYSFTHWSNQLFDNLGTYIVKQDLTLNGQDTYTVQSNQFNYIQRGIFSKFWNNVIYQPIFNVLVLIVSFSPNLNLGVAIILLTLLLRAILHTQNKKAMVAQKKLSKIQPKLNAIREKYKGDQQKLAQETLKIWTTEKINPLSSLTPMLIQFPILIALFYVIQGVVNIDNQYLIYDALQHVELSEISSNFLGIIDLKESNIIVLPIIVASLQFIQMYMTLPKTDETSDKTQKSIQSGMLYFMPALIAVVTATLPSGVGLYWGTSTLVGIIQQHFINKDN